LAEVFGVTSEAAAKGLLLTEYKGAIHPDDRDRLMAAIDEALKTGRTYEAEYRAGPSENPKVLVARGQVEHGPDGERRVTGVVIDVTDERRVLAELEERSSALQILNRAAEAIAGNLDLEQLVQAIVDAGVQLTGAQF